MTKADYASMEPGLIALRKKRAELTYLIHSLVERIEDFCTSIRMSTATFYKIQHLEYVTKETWDKLRKGYLRITTREEYVAYMVSYSKAEFDAFEGR